MAAARDSLRRAQPWLGTIVEIKAQGARLERLSVAIEAAYEAIARVHRRMSYHDPASDISRINRSPPGARLDIDPWTHQVLAAALDIETRSRGTFDIGIAPALERDGILPGNSDVRAPTICTAASKSLRLIDRDRVEIGVARVSIDVGGIAKGFAVDRAIDVLKQHGVISAIVNAGGDLATFGPRRHTIHLRNPIDPTKVLATTEVVDAAIASSGTPRSIEFVRLPCAIVDPSTQRIATAVRGATVRASTCMHADALTKVVMIAGTDSLELLGEFDAAAMLVSANGEVLVTANW